MHSAHPADRFTTDSADTFDGLGVIAAALGHLDLAAKLFGAASEVAGDLSAEPVEAKFAALSRHQPGPGPT
jgi:hypothetical protein